MLKKFFKQRIIRRMSYIEKMELIQEIFATLQPFDKRDVLNRLKPAGTHLHRNPRKKEKRAA